MWRTKLQMMKRCKKNALKPQNNPTIFVAKDNHLFYYDVVFTFYTSQWKYWSCISLEKNITFDELGLFVAAKPISKKIKCL
jgi:hypothetical protein